MTDFTGAKWCKATASSSDGNCVEIARADRAVGVRDSKDQQGPHLEFTAGEWATFTAAVRRSDLD